MAGHSVTVNILASASLSNGTAAERLVCHPRLRMVAALDRERPAVHIWDCDEGALRERGVVGAESSDYGDAIGWRRAQRTPAVAWHPDPPLLRSSKETGVVQWSPTGLTAPDGVPAATAYRSMAFSADGKTVWASHRHAAVTRHGSTPTS